MSAQDMRDMLGLTGDVARPRPSKKQRTAEKRPLEKGIAREVSALMGERAPPIAMIQVQPKYKQRPRRSHRAAPWEWATFNNQARNDRLLLHHWQRKQTPNPRSHQDHQQLGDNHQDQQQSGDNQQDQQQLADNQQDDQQEQDYEYAKYNIQVEIPTYDQNLYDTQLQDPDWTKEETDYLVATVGEYGQKWPVVIDRYEYQPESGHAKPRTMEHLKARYYTVSAKVLANRTPISSMTAPQYNLYSTLTQFNPVQESSRKKLAEAHLYRSQIEVDEENVLLAELQRIMINQHQTENERNHIRESLEYPITTSNTQGAQYSTSQQLGQLFQQLLQADRMKKDRRLKTLGEHAPSTTPNQAHLQAAAAQSGHRDSISSVNPTRKSGARDSISSAVDAQRALTPHAMNRYFVTTHDRLSSGVSFASDRLHRPRIAKSVIQTERIHAILTHFKIPDIIPLPTQRVIEEFEKLMQKVHVLLDMRKIAEKEDQEIRVKSAEKAVKAEKEGVKVEKENEDEHQKTTGQKRSASVMSSDAQSAKRTKT